MTGFSEHMSKVSTAAMVNGAEAIAECVKAFEREAEARLAALYEAQNHLMEWLGDVQAAIAIEIGKQPEAAPTVERIRQAGRDNLRQTLRDIAGSGLLR